MEPCTASCVRYDSSDRRARQYAVPLAFALCFLALGSAPANGQEQQPSQLFTRVTFAPAFVVATNPFSFNGARTDTQIRSAPSITIEMGRQTDGSQEWHHLYGLPSYGVGVSVAALGAGDRISRPVDVYTFFSWPIARPTKRIAVTTDFGMGMSWNWKAFNHDTNTYTSVLGSDVSARIDWGFYLRYIVTAQTSLYAGVDYTHRSNGGTRQPNQGINVIGPSVGFRYNLAPEGARLPTREQSPFHPAWEFVIGGAGGVKNVIDKSNPDYRSNFGVFNITTGVQRHFYRYGKVAAGTEVAYDVGTGARGNILDGPAQWRAGPANRLALGLFGGYEHVIGRFSALAHVGYNVANGSSKDPGPKRLYERLGWRYHFNDRYSTTFAVRTRGWAADSVEVGVGYKVRRR